MWSYSQFAPLFVKVPNWVHQRNNEYSIWHSLFWFSINRVNCIHSLFLISLWSETDSFSNDYSVFLLTVTGLLHERQIMVLFYNQNCKFLSNAGIRLLNWWCLLWKLASIEQYSRESTYCPYRRQTNAFPHP